MISKGIPFFVYQTVLKAYGDNILHTLSGWFCSMETKYFVEDQNIEIRSHDTHQSRMKMFNRNCNEYLSKFRLYDTI